MTLIQLIRKPRTGKITGKDTRSPALKGHPQARGTCRKVQTMSPKKPNSGNRQVTTVRLSTGKSVICFIPGEGQHGLQEHSTVLVRGGGVPNLPGVQYKVIRGKYDCKGVVGRKSSRSKYGARKEGAIS